jgi:hypothetical protein
MITACMLFQFGLTDGLCTLYYIGNYYSFANMCDKDARLFFTQGCVPVEVESVAAARLDPVEQEPSAKDMEEIESRPKGRQRRRAKTNSEFNG